MIAILRRLARKFELRRLMRVFCGKKENFSALLSLDRPRSTPTRYLAIAAMFKDEGPYLAEWLEFHRLTGIEHVYLYDDGSTDTSCTVLKPYLHEGFVSVIPWAFRMPMDYMQRFAYAHAILNFGVHWRWMAFIDIDEFLFPVEGNSLPTTLVDYERLPAVAVYWTNFGFNGHEKRPSGLTIENYTRPICGFGLRPKSIVDPSKVIGIKTVHLFDFADGPQIGYDEQNRLVRCDDEVGPSNILRLNHYITRSREEFAAKLSKWDRVRVKQSDKRRRQSIQMKEAAFHDNTILRFVPEVKQRLGLVTAKGPNNHRSSA